MPPRAAARPRRRARVRIPARSRRTGARTARAGFLDGVPVDAGTAQPGRDLQRGVQRAVHRRRRVVHPPTGTDSGSPRTGRVEGLLYGARGRLHVDRRCRPALVQRAHPVHRAVAEPGTLRRGAVGRERGEPGPAGSSQSGRVNPSQVPRGRTRGPGLRVREAGRPRAEEAGQDRVRPRARSSSAARPPSAARSSIGCSPTGPPKPLGCCSGHQLRCAGGGDPCCAVPPPCTRTAGGSRSTGAGRCPRGRRAAGPADAGQRGRRRAAPDDDGPAGHREAVQEVNWPACRGSSRRSAARAAGTPVRTGQMTRKAPAPGAFPATALRFPGAPTATTPAARRMPRPTPGDVAAPGPDATETVDPGRTPRAGPGIGQPRPRADTCRARAGLP